jgi:hypothetical protein
MSDQPECFEEFLGKIDPLMQSPPLYQSLEFACVAVRYDTDWILLSGKAVLSTDRPDTDAQVQPLVNLKELIALSARMRADTVNTLVSNLRESWVLKGYEWGDVRLTRPEAGTYSWRMPAVYTVDKGPNPLSRWNRSYSVHGDGPNGSSRLSYSLLEEIDRQLRRREAFKDFDALCSKLGLPARRSNLVPSFLLSAELPARFVSVESNSAKPSLEIDIECVGTPELMINWLPQQDLTKVPGWQREPNAIFHHVSVPVPTGAVRAELMLYFSDLEADTKSLDITMRNLSGGGDASAVDADSTAPAETRAAEEAEELKDLVAEEDFVSYLRSEGFSFSPTVDQILDEASRWVQEPEKPEAQITSSRLLFAILDPGAAPSAPKNAAGFLRQWFRDHPLLKYRDVKDDYFKSLKHLPEPAGKRSVTEYAYGILVRAREIAEQTSRGKGIHARHLLSALLVFGPAGKAPRAQRPLIEMGVDLHTLRRDFLDFTRRAFPNDDQSAWEQVLLPDEPRSGPSTHVARDQWTVDDSLGYYPYAYAIYRFLTDKGTKPPLAISIQAPWGGGKTSLMRMIQAQLDPEAAKRVQDPVEGSSQRASVKDVLCEIDRVSSKESDGADEKSSGSSTLADGKRAARGRPIRSFEVPPIEGGGQRRVTIWFNAWKYESTSQVWAGLADSIVQQIGERLGPVKRELFWFQLQLRRVSSGKVRSKIHEQVTALFAEKALPFLWLYVLAPSLSFIVALIGRYFSLPTWQHLGWAALVASITGDALGACSQFGAAKSNVEGQNARVILGEYVEAPNYGANLGFVHHVVEDLKRVFAIIPPKYLPMVIFIDDLDRCSPNKVADVVEAINLFLAGEFPHCMFILGIDDEMVAAALDKAHSDVIAKLPGYAKSASIGWRFMDKFVQLPFVLPPPASDELTRYAISLLSQDGGLTAIDMGTRDRAARAIEQGQIGSASPENIVQEVMTKQQLDNDQKEELRKEVEIIQEMNRNINSFSDDGKTIKELILDGARQFSNNPRDVKRFVNVFRFYYFLRAAREAHKEPIPSLPQLTRWIILSLGWPEVVRWLRRHGANRSSTAESCLLKLEDLAQNYKDQRSWQQAAESTLGLKAAETHWLADEDLTKFFQNESRLPEGDRLSASSGKGLW